MPDQPSPEAAERGPMSAYVARPRPLRAMPYRRCGRSGLLLPAVSLGLWQNFGDDRPLEASRAILRRAFDLGVTHFDLANNYGPPYGSAEINFGRVLAEDFRRLPRRAGHLDQGRLRHVARPLRRLGLAQVPAGAASTRACRGWASTTSTSSTRTASTPTPRSRRRWARSTPRCARARRCYVGISSYSRRAHREAAEILASWARRCSSTSRRTRCSTAGSRPACSTSSSARASAASRSRRSPRACSPTATSTACRRTRGAPRRGARRGPAHRGERRRACGR